MIYKGSHPSPLSSSPALHWARPSPCPTPFICLQARPPRSLGSYWLFSHVISFQGFLLVWATPSHLSPDPAFSSQGLQPHPEFIHSATSECVGRESDSDPLSPRGVQGTVGKYGSSLQPYQPRAVKKPSRPWDPLHIGKASQRK